MRSKAHPLGLPGLSEQDAQKVLRGNKLLAITQQIVRRCRRQGTPVSVENPRRSRLWWTPGMLDEIARGGAKAIVDYCQFALPWQKSTTFAHWGRLPLHQLEKRCKPCGNLCSATGRPHKRLEGNAPGGRRWTLIAEPYPWKLVHDYAVIAATTLIQAASSSPERLR